jgi:ubiquinone/menaquinone biosynthesis C-methylase UbiE
MNSMRAIEAQSLDVKRAEVEFHNFASLGEPQRASRIYREENTRRAAVLHSMEGFLGSLTPFLEIGANAGHSSLMLMQEFGAEGFALDISADSLRHGYALMEDWGVRRGPIRLAGDAVRLPFRDGSLQAVVAYQMLSQFMDIEAVFVEAKRVLRPGGLFIFAEEPIRRAMTLRLWRAPYEEQMTWLERLLMKWGLLPFLVSDVIGAGQEENFGIRQNHRLTLNAWHQLMVRHFTGGNEIRVFVPQRGPLERICHKVAVRLDPYLSEWRAAKLLGGTLAAACRKEGTSPAAEPFADRFEELLACPDCGSAFLRDATGRLECRSCGYGAELDAGVYNLLATPDRDELYPGDRADVLDFSRPSHAEHLGEGWYALEGVHGNKYRWIGERATATLQNMRGGAQRLRLRGFRPDSAASHQISIEVNGKPAGQFTLERPGLFVLECALPAAVSYKVALRVSPTHQEVGGSRILSVNLSMLRLLPA